jgi:exosome complex component RRP43
VWVLYLDIYILNAAGSLLDTALLAALSALQDTTLPLVHLTAEGNVERGPDSSSDGDDQQQQQQQQQGVALVLGCQPLCLTCGVYKGRLVAEPDHEEEQLMGASISVVVDEQQRLLGEWHSNASAVWCMCFWGGGGQGRVGGGGGG